MGDSPKVLIIGGGIGGLCAAVALRRAGFNDVSVFEQAPAYRAIGFGLTLWSNAVRALDRLGVGPAVRALAPRKVTRGAIRRADGRILLELPGDLYERAFGAPGVPLHRADLLAILLAALPPGTVRNDCHCEGFAEDAAGVTAHFTGGRAERGDLLIGADGIRSVTRRTIFGDGLADPLRYAGYTAWRGVCPFPHDGLIAGETWGRGRRFGIVPIGGNGPERVYWFAAADAPQGQTDAPDGSKAKLLSLFAGWHEPIEALVRATSDDAIERRDLYDREPRMQWSSPAGRATLLGDAAHPTTPNLGQGACQAIEDAVVLADCLKQSPADLPRALAAYESARASHTARVVNESRKLGQICQWSNPLACALRNAIVSRTAPEKQMKRMAWVLGHGV
jgi:2-polyprenyl-6-methoxyphenol hydroxylase-like FAD-dependent oxidoreductase